MIKPTKRKAFNFLRSYFDLFNELESDADKLSFLTSIINKQFLDEDPKGLNFVVNLCYESQRHAIEQSVKGYKSIKKHDLLGNPIEAPTQAPLVAPSVGGSVAPSVQVKEKGKVKEYIKDIASPPIGVEPLYFYFSKAYHKMFYENKPDSKSLNEAKLSEWIKTVRLLIEVDKVEPIYLVTIKFFLQAGIEKEKGVDTFWSDTIYSINALRKKGKDGTYQFDRIRQSAKQWINKNPEKESEILRAFENLMAKVNGKEQN